MRVICYRELLDARSRDESRAIRPMRRRYVGEAPMPADTSLISKIWREPRTIDAAHEDTFERLILARIDFLYGTNGGTKVKSPDPPQPHILGGRPSSLTMILGPSCIVATHLRMIIAYSYSSLLDHI